MRKFTLCNEGWRDDDVLFFAQNVTMQNPKLVLHTIRSDNPRNTSRIKCKDLLLFFSPFNFDSTRINFCYNIDSER